MQLIQFRSFAVVWLLLGLCWPAHAELSMQVQVGWNGIFRVGRWTPIHITLADPAVAPARNVRLELMVPHDETFSMRIVQLLAVRAEPTTYVLYAPFNYQASSSIAIVRDANTSRKLAEVSFEQVANPQAGFQGPWFGTEGEQHLVIGASGRSNVAGQLSGPFDWTDNTPDDANSYNRPSVRVGFLSTRYLPQVMVGYNSLDVLILNDPDLNAMTLDQQHAIARWVRGGGRLLLWPGAGAVSPDSPLMGLLPCQIGPNGVIALSLEDTKKLGVQSRVERVAARELQPGPSATVTEPALLQKGVICYGRAGLGRVGVFSFDPSQLIFHNRDDALKFWRPILRDLIAPPSMHDPVSYSQPSLASENRRLTAVEAVVDRLGDVPGVGRFDFSYIAVVMLAMMFIVGPVDWFVLKKLGRQPWTWATTIGWIALITVGALYMGYIYRSGDLHYRTVRLVDQADDQVVAVSDTVGLYSPRTQAYEFRGPSDAWWEPANIDQLRPYRSSPRTATEIAAVQDVRSNRLLPMPVTIWNLRFMQSELDEPGACPAVIRTELTRGPTNADGQTPVSGTITNLSGYRLDNVVIRSRDGSAVVTEPIPPNQTVRVELLLDKRGISGMQAEPKETYRYSRYGSGVPNPYYAGSDASWGFMNAVCDASANRAHQINLLLARDPWLAVICAQSRDVEPAVELVHSGSHSPMQQHHQVIRALVRLGEGAK